MTADDLMLEIQSQIRALFTEMGIGSWHVLVEASNRGGWVEIVFTHPVAPERRLVFPVGSAVEATRVDLNTKPMYALCERCPLEGAQPAVLAKLWVLYEETPALFGASTDTLGALVEVGILTDEGLDWLSEAISIPWY